MVAPAPSGEAGPGAGDGPRPGQLIPNEDPQAVALGAEVYAGACAACHGTHLEGQVADWRVPGPDGLPPAPPHDASGHT